MVFLLCALPSKMDTGRLLFVIAWTVGSLAPEYTLSFFEVAEPLLGAAAEALIGRGPGGALTALGTACTGLGAGTGFLGAADGPVVALETAVRVIPWAVAGRFGSLLPIPYRESDDISSRFFGFTLPRASGGSACDVFGRGGAVGEEGLYRSCIVPPADRRPMACSSELYSPGPGICLAL